MSQNFPTIIQSNFKVDAWQRLNNQTFIFYSLCLLIRQQCLPDTNFIRDRGDKTKLTTTQLWIATRRYSRIKMVLGKKKNASKKILMRVLYYSLPFSFIVSHSPQFIHFPYFLPFPPFYPILSHFLPFYTLIAFKSTPALIVAHKNRFSRANYFYLKTKIIWFSQCNDAAVGRDATVSVEVKGSALYPPKERP